MVENNSVAKVTSQSGLTSTTSIELAVRSSFSEAASDRRIGRDVDIGDLYAGETPTAQLISRARQLLADAEQLATTAQRQLADGDDVGADHDIALLQANLPELFCCRSLSDGLGAVVIALHHALSNRKGDFLNLDQAYAVAVACHVVLEVRQPK
jgi:hypothetical protein